MRQKTSFFNKTIFLKNLTHFWPIWVIYTLCYLVMGPIRLNSTFRYSYAQVNLSNVGISELLTLDLYHCITDMLNPVFIFLFAIVAAVAVFSYLYSSRSANMLHAFPVRREELFVTNSCAGFVMLTVPQLIAFAGSIFVCLIYHAARTDYLIKAFLLMLGMTFFAYCVAIFTVMITGHLLAAPVYFVIANFIYSICRMAVNTIISLIAYGFSDTQMLSKGDFLSPLYYLFFHVNVDIQSTGQGMVSTLQFQGEQVVIAYVIAAIVILLLALIFYKRKHLETAGDIIAFYWMKPVLRWVGTLIASICGALALFSVLYRGYYAADPEQIFLFLLIAIGLTGICAFFVIEMLLEKSFKIFRRSLWVECGIYTVLMLIFFSGIELDVFGLEKHLPQADEIESIYMSSTYPMKITEKDEIEKVLAINKEIIADKKENEAYFETFSSDKKAIYLKLIYYLEDGSEHTRSYALPAEASFVNQPEAPSMQISELEQNPIRYLESNFTSAYNEIVITSASFDLYDENYGSNAEELTQDESELLFEALKKDIESGQFKSYPYYSPDYQKHVYANILDISFQVPDGAYCLNYVEGIKIADSSEYQNARINLTTDYKNTINALIDLKMIKDTDDLTLQYKLEQFWEKENEVSNVVE